MMKAKLKESFIQRVLREGKVITPDYLYFTEELTSAMEGVIRVIYRTKNTSAIFIQNKLSITSYEVIGAYDIDGMRI